MRNAHPRSKRRTYRSPLLIASASLLGLISALIGDGVFDVISWLALGGVLAVIGWAFAYRWKRMGS